MDNSKKLEILNNINNGLKTLANEFEEKINAIDNLFCEYTNSNCDNEKSWNERLFESQFNSLFFNSKALIDSINENQRGIDKVIKEFGEQ